MLVFGYSLSLLTPYIAMNINIFPKQLVDTFSFSTPIGKSILSNIVDFYSRISINNKSKKIDLDGFDILDVYVILSTHWIHTFFLQLSITE